MSHEEFFEGLSDAESWVAWHLMWNAKALAGGVGARPTLRYARERWGFTDDCPPLYWDFGGAAAESQPEVREIADLIQAMRADAAIAEFVHGTYETWELSASDLLLAARVVLS